MSHSPACPQCGALVGRTIDGDLSANGRRYRRRRECPQGHRFTTYEQIRPRLNAASQLSTFNSQLSP